MELVYVLRDDQIENAVRTIINATAKSKEINQRFLLNEN